MDRFRRRCHGSSSRCAALEDLAYAKATGRREYAANAERSFDWLFPTRP